MTCIPQTNCRTAPLLSVILCLSMPWTVHRPLYKSESVLNINPCPTESLDVHYCWIYHHPCTLPLLMHASIRASSIFHQFFDYPSSRLITSPCCRFYWRCRSHQCYQFQHTHTHFLFNVCCECVICSQDISVFLFLYKV